jgi:4-hydroxyphenylpyruvate dioxygenase-like putative hemolysin
MDHHVPSAVSVALKRRGIDVLTAAADEYARASDESILRRATELGRIVYTNDEDYLGIAHRWRQESRSFAGIVFAQQQRAGIGKTIEDLDLIAQIMNAEEMSNRVQFIPL